jgi:hypothetical protein
MHIYNKSSLDSGNDRELRFGSAQYRESKP